MATTTTTITARQRVVDLRPANVRFRAYAGDPFAVTIRLIVNGGPPAQDLSSWVWTAQVRTENGMVPFRTTPTVDGVELYMSGTDTARLAEGSRHWRMSVHGRNPLASEGYTVIDGHMMASARLTQGAPR